jgi:chloramphenicol O-acetyltransferase
MNNSTPHPTNIPNSYGDILSQTRILKDHLRDFIVAYLYYNDIKVGKMEYRLDNLRLQGQVKVLVRYDIDPEYMELFQGEENPIKAIDLYVKTLLV